MRSLCSGVIYLALCSCFVAALDLDGCLRGPLFVETAKSSKSLRKEIKEALGFSVDGNGTIAGVLVISKTRNESVYAVFAGRNKGRKAVAFQFDVDYDLTPSFEQISFEQFFNYLTCQRLDL
ncbi:unnamed protein product [Heligmosomoides polygyrus]|uniref:TPM_phosphatase domain-containing protein n=1 Tax=Heligmosomoides polygyrus TaxID=6339 RepID=A0A183G4M3_HELPZ|nr:unnamed protein product [Heligmosomoides polygyrus]